MRILLQTMAQHLAAGRSLVLVTILHAAGATPRGPGAAMLAGAAGYLCGTVGGGTAEHRALQLVPQVLAEQCSRHLKLPVNEQSPADGQLHLLLAYLSPDTPALAALCHEADRYFAAGCDLWLSFDNRTGTDWQLFPEQPAPAEDRFLRKIATSSRVYLLGGGHVAMELVPVLSRVVFRCVVLDDREAFADPRRFPDALSVQLADFHRLQDHVQIRPTDYVCITTRGHDYDLVLQAHVLQCRPRFLGVIGSRAKAEASRKALKAQFGFPDCLLDRIISPMGLSIDARTPAEIAVSIAAQMIQIRAACTNGEEPE